MKVFKLNSQKEVTLRINKYRLDWENDGSSSLETRFRDLIKPFWFGQIICYQILIPGSLLRIDFLNCNKKLAVETNGSQHNTFNKHFHKNSRANYLASIRRDFSKREWCESNSIDLLELEIKDLDLFSPKYILDKFGIDIL